MRLCYRGHMTNLSAMYRRFQVDVAHLGWSTPTVPPQQCRRRGQRWVRHLLHAADVGLAAERFTRYKGAIRGWEVPGKPSI
eukprot:8869885-Pyramimonas_sp.AAC.1